MSIKNDGKEFESIVAAIHRQFAHGAKVTENEKIVGKSGRERQIDVAIRTTVMGYKVFILVECKDYQEKVGIGIIDELIGKMEDVGADKAVLVSNSGFTKDALERGKQDTRIQLSSVVDIQNEKLKAKMAIPFLAHFDSPETFQLQVSGTGDITFDTNFLAEQHQRFRRLWSDDKLDTSPGEHEHPVVLQDDEDGKVTVTFIYTVKRKSYFKRVPLEESVGIYNHNDGGYTTNKIVLERITMDDIDSTWEVVEGDLPEATMQLFGVESFAEPEQKPETNEEK